MDSRYLRWRLPSWISAQDRIPRLHQLLPLTVKSRYPTYLWQKRYPHHTRKKWDTSEALWKCEVWIARWWPLHTFQGVLEAFLEVSLYHVTWLCPQLLINNSAYINSFAPGGSNGDLPSVDSYGPNGPNAPITGKGGKSGTNTPKSKSEANTPKVDPETEEPQVESKSVAALSSWSNLRVSSYYSAVHILYAFTSPARLSHIGWWPRIVINVFPNLLIAAKTALAKEADNRQCRSCQISDKCWSLNL